MAQARACGRRARRGEGAAAEPAPQRAARRAPRRGRGPARSATACVGVAVAGPHLGEREHRRFDDQRRLAARVVAAQVGAALVDHQPPAALAGPGVGEAEVDHDRAVLRKLVELDEAADVPHQEADVELAALEPAADPARAPVAEGHHDRAQLLAGAGEVVLGAGAAAGDALDDADLLELAQPLREQRRRHARHAAADVVEAGAAAEQLAHDERRPALAEDLGAARDGAELAVVDHGPEPMRSPQRRRQHRSAVQFLDALATGRGGAIVLPTADVRRRQFQEIVMSAVLSPPAPPRRPAFDPERFKTTTRAQWQSAAEAWHRWGPSSASGSAPPPRRCST